MEYTIIEGNYAKIGVSKMADTVYFTFEGEKEKKCAILLYTANGEQDRIPVPDEYCIGALRSVGIRGLKWKKLNYNYEIDGKLVFDQYARKVIGREKWADPKRLQEDYQIRAGFDFAEFDWCADRFPEIPREQMVMYKLNVRSFTMDGGAVGRKKGTFAGVMEKIPYLKALGVTSLELMPVYEFEELAVQPYAVQDVEGWSDNAKEGYLLEEEKKPPLKINCWGYLPGHYYAPKASYASTGEPSTELKKLIQMLHKNQMECILEMYFDEKMNQNIAVEILRYWVMEYHVDGFHLLGAALPVDAMAQDLILRRTKLFAEGFSSRLFKGEPSYPHLFVYNDDFLYASRKLLSRNNGNMPELLNQLKRQNAVFGFVNYVAGNNGFTLADLFSYNEKHNEENGEDNQDGLLWNFSCNGGVEGATRKRNILEYRKKQMRNAIVLVLIGQGVPLLMAGDEFGNSQQGNNNCYCQDNKTGWANWGNRKRFAPFTKFVQQMIAFRRQHPILRSRLPMQMCDYASRGCPDLSYHGENAWIASGSLYPHAVGILYYGAYAVREDGTEDDYLYIGLNFHIQQQSLALPKLPHRMGWYVAVDTADKETPFFETPKPVEKKHQIEVPPQAVMILVGK
ncbi:MAG: glycogen operon protein GlgX [Eubacterium sp.]|nr:glycogen operon protein GlgX [Eubacterium sp.]